MKVSYKSSGVNISEADKFIREIKPLIKKTFSHNVLSGIGNFGAFYRLDFKKYKDPVFVSSVDGVGTKIKIASELRKLDTIGEDLVNHCVNDIAVCGAVPLFFLDYYAAGRLRSGDAVNVIKGIIRGCERNNCSLIGGETAEMPGVYSNTDFDLAGAIVGIADRNQIINSKSVKKGNILVGLESNGLHTNGYSMVRRIFENKRKLKRFYPEINETMAHELMKVHRSYLDIIQSSVKRFKINSISHITGGGIVANTKRIVPKNLTIRINWNSWHRPPIFKLIQKEGNVSESDMRKTFNLGIGLIFIVSQKIAGSFIKFLISKNEFPHILGSIA